MSQQSLPKFKWILPEENENSNIIENILSNRFGSDFVVEDFVSPKYFLADPFGLSDMDRAVARIMKAMVEKEKIVIFGDYDVDGVTSVSLLYELFIFLGQDVDVYIPERHSEGYGLKLSSLKNIKAGGAQLVITVDCGVRDAEVIKKMQEDGLDVIVTDHHQIGHCLPDCVAVINPKRPNNKYNETELAGVGVAYALARAILIKSEFDQKKIDWWLKWNLDLVALGTIADMVPLVGENRALVYYGLIVLRKTKRKGLIKLMEITGLRQENISSSDVGYILAPRLNAAGRLENALTSFNLLVEKNELEAKILADNLNNKNLERRVLTDEILYEAMAIVENKKMTEAIVVANEKWSRGVVGLVASRLVEKYNRPSFVGEIEKDMVFGSVRGIEQINVVNILDKVADLLDHYGGHKVAGGFSLKEKNWEEFQERIITDVKKQLNGKDLSRHLNIDALLKIEDINWSLLEKIDSLSPFGMGNFEPVFAINNIRVENWNIIGKDRKHLKGLIMDRDNNIELLWWKEADFFDLLKHKNLFDVAFKIDVSEYMQQKKIYLKIIDIKPIEL